MNNNNKNDENKLTKAALKKEIMEWIIVIEVAVILAVVLNMFLIVNAVVPTASMEPTIMTNDRLFGNRLAYNKEEPKRGEIIIFKFPDDESQLFIKRIIGEPGDTVEMKDGNVFINGERLDEPYLATIPYGNYGPITVPEDAYFMMGDNRNNSADSRFWNQPFVYRDKILGRASFCYYPFSHFGKIE